MLGASAGLGVQILLPKILQDFLPYEVEFFISWSAVAKGMGAGLVISLLFTLLPLLAVRDVSPLVALRSAFADYSEAVRGELAIFEAAAASRRRYGAQAIRQYIISKTDSVSDLLEVAVLLKEGQQWLDHARQSELVAWSLEQQLQALFEKPQDSVGGYRQIMMDQLFGDMLASRLEELEQKENPPFLRVGAGRGLFPAPRTKDEAVLQALVPNGGVTRGLDALVTEQCAKGIVHVGPSDEPVPIVVADLVSKMA